jgi:hypothetical protein
MSSYSVFIPRIFANIRENRIAYTFHSLSIGDVNHIDLVRKTSKNGEIYNMAFVHFNEMYNNPGADAFREDVEDPDKQAKIVYDDPWFWIILPFDKKIYKQPDYNMLHNQSQSCIPQQVQQVPPQPVQPVPPQPIQPVHPVHPVHLAHSTHQQGMWMMTEFGFQWCWNPVTMSPPVANNTRMIPSQIKHGNRNVSQRNHPRKRLNLTNIKQKSNQNNNNYNFDYRLEEEVVNENIVNENIVNENVEL